MSSIIPQKPAGGNGLFRHLYGNFTTRPAIPPSILAVLLNFLPAVLALYTISPRQVVVFFTMSPIHPSHFLPPPPSVFRKNRSGPLPAGPAACFFEASARFPASFAALFPPPPFSAGGRQGPSPHRRQGPEKAMGILPMRRWIVLCRPTIFPGYDRFFSNQLDTF